MDFPWQAQSSIVCAICLPAQFCATLVQIILKSGLFASVENYPTRTGLDATTLILAPEILTTEKDSQLGGQLTFFLQSSY